VSHQFYFSDALTKKMAFDPILNFSATLKIKKTEFPHSTFVNRHSSFPWFTIPHSSIVIRHFFPRRL